MANSSLPARLAVCGVLPAVALFAGCGTSHPAQPPATGPAGRVVPDDRTVPQYLTVAHIQAMPRCSATFTKRVSEYGGSFTTADGKQFILGDDRGEQWVWHFVGSLKEGTTYALPDALTSYINAPQYVTAKEIAAMPPCTATLASRTPCSSTFTTADGKWFGIGDPGSGAQVSQFIWSLEEGATCKLPEAFLAYQRKPR